MGRRDGMQVAEGCHQFVAMDVCAGKFARDNFTKNTGCHFFSFFRYGVGMGP
jgi:hypothetical protein